VTLRHRLGRARAHVHDWLGANQRARQRLDGSCAAIIFYHRVLPRDAARRDAVEPGMFVTPESFSHQLDWLADCFTLLPLHEIVERIGANAALPERACALTFDDGWRDNLEYALPELVRRRLPATLFVVSERVGSDAGFWPDEVCRRLARAAPDANQRVRTGFGLSGGGDLAQCALAYLKRLTEAERSAALDRIRELTPEPAPRPRELLDWAELEQLAAAGVSIESHGATHAMLTGLSDAEAADELRCSRERLREHGHGRHALFAYPSGDWDVRVSRLAAAQGYRAAFTIDPGLARIGADRFALPRLGVHQDVSSTRAEFLYRVPGRR